MSEMHKYLPNASGREIGVEVRLSTEGWPSAREMKADVRELRRMRETSKLAIDGYEEQILKQRDEQVELRRLAEGHPDADGVVYNSDACSSAADRCDKHVRMFEATIKKERAKVRQLEYMIGEIETRIRYLAEMETNGCQR